MTTKYRTKALPLSCFILLFSSLPAFAQQQIKIVGSSTVFPFVTSAAERFGRNTDFKTPIVESTGSGGGLKLFCSGVGSSTPDIATASRRIKASEIALCAKNDVGDIVEVKIGFDGIVFANSRDNQIVDLSQRDIFLALAKTIPDENGQTIDNPFTTWRDVNPALPDIKIEVMGPPPTSGTRDAFVELVMEEGCKTFDWVKELKDSDRAAYLAICHTLREDGAYIEGGENDNLIVQKLAANPSAFGIFGFGFLDSNTDIIQGNAIEGVSPEFENIASGDYPVSRSLYLYVKKAHGETVSGLVEFLRELTSENAWGPEGYLADKGLIPMPYKERDLWSTRATSLENIIF